MTTALTSPTATPESYRHERVTLADMGGAGIPAILTPQRWNGYECPFFPLDTFTAHADAWRELFPEGDVNGDGSTIASYADNGILSLTSHYSDGTPLAEVSRATVGGADYYTVGLAAFVWVEV